jgi:hypothetical protein
MGLREVLGLMGVDAGRGQDRRELGHEAGDGREARGAGQVGRAEDGPDPGSEGPANGVGPVGVEFGSVEVGV